MKKRILLGSIAVLALAALICVFSGCVVDGDMDYLTLMITNEYDENIIQIAISRPGQNPFVQGCTIEPGETEEEKLVVNEEDIGQLFTVEFRVRGEADGFAVLNNIRQRETPIALALTAYGGIVFR